MPQLRHHRRRRAGRVLRCEALEPLCLLAGDVVISEVLANNDHGLVDQNSDFSDWIELTNTTNAVIHLAGWHLTDKPFSPKWTFPEVDIGPHGRLIVFASGKDRSTGPELHTNFQLDSEGEYLGLLRPDNSVESELTPQLPQQYPDISYGLVEGSSPAVYRYFRAPSPGTPNGSASIDRGPIISDVAQTPNYPTDDQDLVITARLTQPGGSVSGAVLHYRVMYGNEFTATMFDNGSGADLLALDGIYTAKIPASASTPGQMVRYYVTANSAVGDSSRWPLFADPVASEQYLGTVIANPAASSSLPVLEWFTQSPGVVTYTPKPASVYYNGEFYDNVSFRWRGVSAPQGGKASFKFDFNPGHYLNFQPGYPRVEEINLNSTYQDKSYLRPILSFDTYRDSGVPSPEAFNVRVQQNNAFYSVAVLTEQIDKTFLERRGLDPEGALYKNFDGLRDLPLLVEKKTRQDEPNTDLMALYNGLLQPNFIFDNLDLPAVFDYMAAGALIQDGDRYSHNYYLYRDTNGTGLWQFLPWDKDLTFGRFALNGGDIMVDDFLMGNPLMGQNGTWIYNKVFDAVLSNPTARQMYLRRLRTLMDELLQTPETPAALLKLERQVDMLAAPLAADAALDQQKWGSAYSYAPAETFERAISLLKTDYLAVRRPDLFVTRGIDNVANDEFHVGIPHAQSNIAALPIAQRKVAFGALEVSPLSNIQDQEYFTLVNSNTFALDISGWRVTQGVDYVFPAGTVIPAAGTLYVSPNVSAFRARTTGPSKRQGLLISGGYDGALSAQGETLQLVDASGAPIASLTFPAQPSAAQNFLRISELMYHPPTPAGGDGSDLEFIELVNNGAGPLNLNGVRFTNGIDFTFANTTLGAGGRVLVVKNRAAFEARYGFAQNIAGEFVDSSLDNKGERVKLDDAAGGTVFDFIYSDAWYPSTDGDGYSLVVVDAAAATVGLAQKTAWRTSFSPGGSPGVTDIGVVGRYLFYNNSKFDGHDPAANGADDGAIATDKLALRAGVATIANYSNYSRGLNGIMIDISAPAHAPSLADFAFRVGNQDNFATWTTAPAPLSLSVRGGAGLNGADRVTIVWPDLAIKGKWLEVTVRSTLGLAAPDVFYFGNAPGEAGDSATSAVVNATDEILTRQNPRSFLIPAALSFAYDFNRDGFVNAADQIIARGSVTAPGTELKLITLPQTLALALKPSPSMLDDQVVQQLAIALAADRSRRVEERQPEKLADATPRPARPDFPVWTIESIPASTLTRSQTLERLVEPSSEAADLDETLNLLFGPVTAL